MTATYQSNLLKIKKHILKATPASLHFDPRAYPHHDHEFVHNTLWHGFDPWKDSYGSPLTHVNLYQVTVPAQINNLPFLLVRDGLFSMVDFFSRCPNPKKIESVMLIHNCLRDYVPTNWRSKILFYEFEYRKPEGNVFKQKNNQVLIKANVTHDMFDYELAKKKVLELKKLKYEKMFFFFFNRSNPFLAKEWDNDYRTHDFVISQSKFFNFLNAEKIEHEFLTWKEFFHIPGMHQYDCVDLNFKEKYYIDDFTNYFFSKKGCEPFNVIKAKGHISDVYVPVSGFHGIRVLGQEPSYKIRSDEIISNLKSMNIVNSKCDLGAFQMINDHSEKFLEPAWFKSYN